MQENIPVTPMINQKTTSPFLYILMGFGITVVAFGLGYMLRGYSVDTYKSQKLMVSEPTVQEKTPLAMAEDEAAEASLPPTIHENEDFFYTNKELGFSLLLPKKYNILEKEYYMSNDSDSESIEFTLPIKLESETASQMVFGISKASPGAEMFQYADQLGKLLGTNNNGEKFYYFHPLDVGVLPSQPEYKVFMDLVDQDLFPIVKDGFKLL